ncbi:MAG: transposase, partial [Proteobacteria bacterium]|nr:transposase [Pseudomonadota bacterium]
MEGLEGRGHHMYTDNYCSSPAIFGDLQCLGFGACGTVRKNRRGLPDETMKAKLKKGEVASKQIDSSMLVLKWMDKQELTMLSTIHDDSFVTK